MRWTNYFIHPGDNRYYVFTYQEEKYADAFQARLDAGGIPFERHEENSECYLEWRAHISKKP